MPSADSGDAAVATLRRAGDWDDPDAWRPLGDNPGNMSIAANKQRGSQSGYNLRSPHSASGSATVLDMNEHDPDELPLADICDRLGLQDPMGFLHEVYHAIAETYRINSERHDEAVGDDNMTFAQLMYRNSWAQAEQALESYDGVRTSRPRGSLTIHTPGRDLKVYRGGSDEHFSIESYDPETGSLTRQEIAENNAQQLSLFEQDPLSDDDEHIDARLSPKTWFIVHSGNPDDGLLRIWIGAPTRPEDPSQSPWSFVLPLPDLCAEQGCGGHRPDSGVSLEPSPHQPQGPSYDQIPEPEIRVEPITEHGD